MRASKSSDAQKAFILKRDQVGKPLGEICLRAGFGRASGSEWNGTYPGLAVDAAEPGGNGMCRC